MKKIWKKVLNLDEGAGGEVLEFDTEGGACGFKPADTESPTEIGEDGVVDGDNHFGVDFGDIFDGFGYFAPRSRNWNAEEFGLFDRRNSEGIAGIYYLVVDDDADVLARNLTGDDRGVVLAEEVELETV